MKHIRYAMIVISLCTTLACNHPPDTAVKKRQFEAQRNLGEVYLQQGEYSSALRELLKAEILNPNDPYLHNSLGIVYTSKKRLDKALFHFKTAISLKPDYAPARNNLGRAYLLQKNWDAAIACLQEITGNLIYATPHFPLYNIGWAYYNKKEYEAAEKYYQQSLDIEPDYAPALWGLGLTYLAQGKTDHAERQLEKAVQTAPSFAQAHLDLGKVYEIKGKKDRAKAAYQRALTLSPENEIGQSAKKALKKLKKFGSRR